MRFVEISRLIQEALQLELISATPLVDGQKSLTFDLVLANGAAILRIRSDCSAYAGTVHNLDVLRGLGLPVPRVLATDLTWRRHPFEYLILEKIPGRDLRHELASMTRHQVTTLAEQVADYQRTVNRLPAGNGFGYVAIGDRGPCPSWWDLVGSEIDKRSGAEPDSAVDRLRFELADLALSLEGYLCRVPPTCFLDDITVKNVIVEGAVLRGFVDFDCVCYGDPVYWLALTTVGIACDIGLSQLVYAQELRRCYGLRPEQDRALLLYAARIAVGFLDRYTGNETNEWRRRMLAAVTIWKDRLASDSAEEGVLVDIDGAQGASSSNVN